MPIQGRIFLAKMELKEAVKNGKKIWFNNLNLKITKPEHIDELCDADFVEVYNQLMIAEDEEFDKLICFY